MDNQNQLLNKIIAEKIPCVFVSPHLDDSILSAGGLIYYLSKRTRVIAITVFTEASQKPYTLSAKKFLYSCGYKDAQKLFEIRKKEDSSIFENLGIEYHHLGFTDAAWRKKENTGRLTRLFGKLLPEFLHIYPVHRININSNRIAKEDGELMNIISGKLSETIKDENYYVFCPLGVNTHIDHVIIREIIKKNFKNVIFWKDFPYSNYRNIDPAEIGLNNNPILVWNESKKEKLELIEKYATQKDHLFSGDKIDLKPEVYYNI